MSDSATTDIGGELLHRHRQAWERFRGAVARVEHRLDQTTPAGWTAKEMLGHMGFWEEAVEPVVVGMLRGHELRDDWAFGSGYVHPNDEEWPLAVVHNAREAAWAAARSTAEVLDRLDRAHARAVEVFESVTAEEWGEDRFRSYVEEKTGHYDEHRAELEAIESR